MKKREIDVDELVEFVIGPPSHNITEAAAKYECQRSTIKELLALVSKPNSLYYNETKARLLNETLDKLLTEARSKAGSISRRTATITKDEALVFRFKHLYEGISFRKLAEEKGCSHMSITNAINALPLADTIAQDEEIKAMQEKKDFLGIEEKWHR